MRRDMTTTTPPARDGPFLDRSSLASLLMETNGEEVISHV